MATTNEYAKQYTTVRRSINDEQYKLILFLEDNTTLVVKAKSVLISNRPNYVAVLAGNKKYNGIVLLEGRRQIIVFFSLDVYVLVSQTSTLVTRCMIFLYFFPILMKSSWNAVKLPIDKRIKRLILILKVTMNVIQVEKQNQIYLQQVQLIRHFVDSRSFPFF